MNISADDILEINIGSITLKIPYDDCVSLADTLCKDIYGITASDMEEKIAMQKETIQKLNDELSDPYDDIYYDSLDRELACR